MNSLAFTYTNTHTHTFVINSQIICVYGWCNNSTAYHHWVTYLKGALTWSLWNFLLSTRNRREREKNSHNSSKYKSISMTLWMFWTVHYLIQINTHKSVDINWLAFVISLFSKNQINLVIIFGHLPSDHFTEFKGVLVELIPYGESNFFVVRLFHIHFNLSTIFYAQCLSIKFTPPQFKRCGR